MTAPMLTRSLPDGTVLIALDLSHLPSERRARVEAKAAEAYWRERAAVRIREVYPAKLARYRLHRAYRETARALHAEAEPFGFVTPRFVQAVMREGR